MSEDDNLGCHLGSAEDLEEYLRGKASAHTSYKLYGTEENLKCIYENHFLYLTNGHNWNDITDRNKFQDFKDYTYFARCFSFSGTENVAMWMLYGGMKRTGIMVDFGAPFLRDAIEEIDEISLGKFKNGKYIEEDKLTGIKNLTKDEFEAYFIDMLYVYESSNEEQSDETDSSKYTIKRHNEKISIKENECKEDLSYLDKVKLFRKEYAWNYENECRLIIKIKKGLIKECTDITDIRIDLTKFFNQTKIKNKKKKRIYVTQSPNYSEKQSAHYPEDIKHFQSKLTYNMQWDLCQNCRLKQCQENDKCKLKNSSECKDCIINN